MRTQRLMAGFFGLVFGGLSLNAGAAAPVETSREVFVAEISSLSQVRFSCKPGVSIDRPFPTHSHVYISLLGLIPASNVLNLSSWGPDFANAQLGDHCAEMTAALEKQLPAQAVITQVFSEGCEVVSGRSTKVIQETVELVVGDTVFSESKRSIAGKCPQ
jgi:hypothetical protein